MGSLRVGWSAIDKIILNPELVNVLKPCIKYIIIHGLWLFCEKIAKHSLEYSPKK